MLDVGLKKNGTQMTQMTRIKKDFKKSKYPTSLTQSTSGSISPLLRRGGGGEVLFHKKGISKQASWFTFF